MTVETDVAIIGAGPGGTTCGSFLKKHDPAIKVSIFEREIFPRDHVGESQLPIISGVLDELGVWDKVERCNFPVKIGATYRWGTSNDLWDFDFLRYGKFDDAPRPGKYEGQRKLTAFQVDRATYDKVLSDHASDLGCDIHFDSAVREVKHDGDRVEGLVLADGTVVKASHYVDATGHSGLLRRAMGVEIEEPSALKNIAIWDYWRNAEWAVSLGVGGTRIQILSIGFGWIWFIPISPDRTSIGFVCPAAYFKQSGQTVEELYLSALGQEGRLQKLIANAQRENRLSTTKDWSFVAKRMFGENWSLVGEASGFADPIISAGLSLTHVGARELAFAILEARRGGDPAWIFEEYERRNVRRVRQHIRFADYWYKANSHFSELKAFTSEIARDVGLELDAEDAFQWFGTGGFVEEDMGVAGLALFRIDQVHQIAGRLSEKPAASALHGFNVFMPRIKGAENVKLARFEKGGVRAVLALERDGKILPLEGLFGWMLAGLQYSPNLGEAMEHLRERMTATGYTWDNKLHSRLTECLDAMVRDGWVRAKYSESLPPIHHEFPLETNAIRTHVDS